MLFRWRATTSQDNSSLSVDPLFNSANNLAPQPGSPVLGAGIPITGITIDFLVLHREPLHPSIGAFESQFVPTTKTLNLTLYLEGLYAGPGMMNPASEYAFLEILRL